MDDILPFPFDTRWSRRCLSRMDAVHSVLKQQVRLQFTWSNLTKDLIDNWLSWLDLIIRVTSVWTFGYGLWRILHWICLIWQRLLVRHRYLSNGCLKGSYSGIERCLCLSQLRVVVGRRLVRRLMAGLRIKSVSNTIGALITLKLLHRHLPNHYFVNLIFDDLFWLTADNWRWDDDAWVGVSETHDLATRCQHKGVCKSIEKLSHTHVFRN